MKLPLTGGCQCGAVRYEIATAPLTVIACHCGECQRQSASAFGMTAPVPRESLTITRGEPAFWERTAESGNIVGAALCAGCGVRLYHIPANKAVLNVKPGTLDDRAWVTPVGHIWTDAAQPWLRADLRGLLYPRQPPTMDALIAAWRDRDGG